MKPLEIDQARRLVVERAVPLGDEAVALGAALGRTLAEDVVATDAVPGFDNSAMDGYAVRAADTGRAARRSSRSSASRGPDTRPRWSSAPVRRS